MALDRLGSNGRGSWGLALLPTGVFITEEVKQIIRYNPEGAKRLVAEAGYPNGLELGVIYPASRPVPLFWEEACYIGNGARAATGL